jgi:hypothetical protein
MNQKVYFAIVLWVVAIVALLGFIVIAPWWAILGAAFVWASMLAMSLNRREDGP